MEKKLKKIILSIWLLAVFSLSYAGFGLNWEYFYGGLNNDEIHHFVFTDDGGVLATGYTESYGTGIWGHPDIWVIKFDAEGSIEWDATYGQPDSLDKAYFILETDGNYLVVGERKEDVVYGNGAGGVIFKIDADGNEIWNKKYGGPEGDMLRHIQSVNSGGFITCGVTRSFGAGFIDGYVVKIDNDGNVEWQNNFGGAGYEVFKQIYPTVDGGYITAGYSNSDGLGSYDIWILKLDNSGNMEWEERIGDAGSNRMHYFCPTSDGNYILTGETENTSGAMELFAMKIDPLANIIWEHIYPATVEGEGKYIEETSDGGFIISGSDSNSLSGPWQTDGWVIKIDENGEFMFDYFVHSSASDVVHIVRQLSAGTYIAAGGNMSHGSGMNDVWIMEIIDDSVELDNQQISIYDFNLRNHPNPFNPETTISFSLAQTTSFVYLEIYNLRGQKVKQLISSQLSTGQHSVVWNGRDDNGKLAPSGIYFYKLKTDDFQQTKKMILMK